VDLIALFVVGLHATHAHIHVLLHSHLEYNERFPHFHGIKAVTIRYSSATLTPSVRRRFDRRSLAAASRARSAADPIAAPTIPPLSSC
jgi:hypothetical protein